MPDLCEAHLERTGQEVPAYRIGLCESCYGGHPIGQRSVRGKKEIPTPPENCWRCGRPRHQGRCGARLVDPAKIEHATYLLTQGKTVAYVMSVAGVPRRVVEEIQASLEITENNS